MDRYLLLIVLLLINYYLFIYLCLHLGHIF